MAAYTTSFFSLGKSGKDTLPLNCFLHWKKDAFLPKGKMPRKKQHRKAAISTTDSDRIQVVVAQSLAVAKGGYRGFRATLTWLDSEHRGRFPDSCWDLPSALDATGIPRSVGFWAIPSEISFLCRSLCPTIFPFSNGSKISQFLLAFAISSGLWRQNISCYVYTQCPAWLDLSRDMPICDEAVRS